MRKQHCDDRGMPDCQSGAVHSLVCGIIYSAVLVTSACVTPIVTRRIAAKPYAIRAAAVLQVSVFLKNKETGIGWRNIPGAYRLLQGSNVRCIWRTSEIRARASITWAVTGRATGFDSYLEEPPPKQRESKVRVTWMLSSTALDTPARAGKGDRRPQNPKTKKPARRRVFRGFQRF